VSAVPFYDLGDILVDGYFMDKISTRCERILLVARRGAASSPGRTCVQPLLYESVSALLREGYEEARGMLEGAPLRRRGRLYFALTPLYSSGRYLAEASDYLADLTSARLLASAYEQVLARLSEGPRGVLCIPIELRDGAVYLGGELNKAYTYLFEKDGAFREALRRLLEPGSSGGSIDVEDSP
jgi:hypothetical protein